MHTSKRSEKLQEELLEKMRRLAEEKPSVASAGYASQLPLGMAKIPMGWPLMAQAYIDFAMWAIGRKEFIQQFTDETGIVFNAPKNGLDSMIDEATGAGKSFLTAFLDWLTVNHWGEA